MSIKPLDETETTVVNESDGSSPRSQVTQMIVNSEYPDYPVTPPAKRQKTTPPNHSDKLMKRTVRHWSIAELLHLSPRQVIGTGCPASPFEARFTSDDESEDAVSASSTPTSVATISSDGDGQLADDEDSAENAEISDTNSECDDEDSDELATLERLIETRNPQSPHLTLCLSFTSEENDSDAEEPQITSPGETDWLANGRLRFTGEPPAASSGRRKLARMNTLDEKADSDNESPSWYN